MSDKYKNFQALAKCEVEGSDFTIEVENRETRFAVVAPHGGTIEPQTSELTRKIAAADFSFYCFNERKSGKERRSLHITSHRFDEPRALKLVASAETVIGIHGCKNDEGEDLILLGGLDTKLLAVIQKQLIAAEYCCLTTGHKFPATNPLNICNRGTSRQGAQIEIPWRMRQLFRDEPREGQRFAEHVLAALNQYQS